MIDPVEALMKSQSLLVPTASSSVAPVPTILPDIVTMKAGDTGTRTLWSVSTLSFYLFAMIANIY